MSKDYVCVHIAVILRAVTVEEVQQILSTLQIQQNICRFQRMPRPREQRNETKHKYSKHEVVWAKITGYPWWPASITCTPSKSNCSYKVDFIGDRSYAFLSESKIASYLDSRHQYQMNKKNNKHFQNAVAVAARKYQELLLKQVAIVKSKGSVDCKTSYQKQQLIHQIEIPQIAEKIQQTSSKSQKQKPNEKKCSKRLQTPKKTPALGTHEQNYTDVCAQRHQALKKGPKEMQSEDLSTDDDKKERIIQQILVRYKLDTIPILRQQPRNLKQSSLHGRKSLHWKKKLIFKNKRGSEEQDAEFGEDQLLTRKLYRCLLQKLHSHQECRCISLSLKDQIMRQKTQKVECLKKVVQLISVSAPQSISSYHSQWVNFYKDSQRQRQKHSNSTMEDQSEELTIKQITDQNNQ